MQEKRTAYFDICPMTGSVRRRITINSSFPDMGVPAYRARKRAAYEERSMRQTVSATGAPAAVGSYSQAVRAGNLLFLSGQLCANPETGRFERESVAAQTRRIMENIRAFLSDMKHFPEFESVYRSYFSAPYPARMTVASAGIYDGLDVEMDAIAYLP